jgi:plastocyanin
MALGEVAIVIGIAHGSRRTTVLAVGAFALLVGGWIVLLKGMTPEDSVHEVRLVVRHMTFFVEGAAEPNPTLRVPRGSRLRLVLTNEDPGYSHNLIVPALGVATSLITRGRSQTLEITVPNAPGVHAYSCGPHAAMMRGNIAIE